MRRIALGALLIVGLVLVGHPVSGQTKKTKDPKDIPGTGAKDKKDDKDGKKDAAGKYPTEIDGKELDGWVKAIRDPDPSMRQTAMRIVPHFGPAARKKALPNLIYTASSKEADVGLRVDAASALGILGGEESDIPRIVSTLTFLLGDQQRTVQIHAAYSLGQFGYHAKSATSSLCQRLQDTFSWEVRKGAAFALGLVAWDKVKGADPHAVSALSKVLYDPLNRSSDPCVAVRLEAINSLSRLGFPQQSPTVIAAEKAALENRVLRDRDKSVAIWARTLLMYLDEKGYLNEKGLGEVAGFLNDEDSKVRQHAAQALGRLGAKAQSTVKDLMEAALDKDEQLRLVAVGALGGMEEPKAVPVLVKILKDKDAPLHLRISAALAIGNLRGFGKSGLKDLVEMLGNKDREMVIGAIAGLAQMGETAKAALPDLKKLSSHKDEGVRKSAEQAIKILTEEPKDTKEKKKK